MWEACEAGVVLCCTHSGAPRTTCRQTDPSPAIRFVILCSTWRKQTYDDFRVAYSQLYAEVYNNLYCCRLTQITILTSWVLKRLQPPRTVFALNVLKQCLLKMLVFVFQYPWGILLLVLCQYAAKAMLDHYFTYLSNEFNPNFLLFYGKTTFHTPFYFVLQVW